MSDHSENSLVLITGGARSGKSTFAEKLAARSGKKVIYLATARAGDEEMAQRIATHRRRRPANFKTVEESLEPHLFLENRAGSKELVLLDCLTLLVSNRILAYLDGRSASTVEEGLTGDQKVLEEAGKSALDYIEILVKAARASPADVVMVTNEVGMGLVPDHPLGRVFRDYAGRANQLVAEAADQVWLVVCGIPRRFK